jgi:YidC/Oxa1 family membrane protein insertase
MNIFVVGISLLNTLYTFSVSVGFHYGIAIILLAILIETLIYPLAYKQEVLK